MTDNEIIKALENEIHLVEYVDGFSANNVDLELLKNTLDLIKRQQAEIERLKEINAGLALNLLYGVVNKDPELRKEIVAVAITEFAEKLKAEILEWHYDFEYYDERKKAAKQVDNLVKEMVVDKDV